MPTYVQPVLPNVLFSLLLGAALGVLFDVFRIIRIIAGISSYGNRRRFSNLYGERFKDRLTFKRGRVFSYVFTFITDLLFGVISSVAFVLFLYVRNYGIFRWYIACGTLIGFYVYHVTAGKALVLISGNISEVLKLIINFLIFLLLTPFELLIKFVRKALDLTVIPAVTKVSGSIDKRRKKMYTLKCIEKLSDFTNLKV